MTNQHPITPPPELVKRWCHDRNKWKDFENILSIRAAQWGADQELEACAEHLKHNGFSPNSTIKFLRAARRLKPPSLKEEALIALHAVATGANDTREQHQDLDTIRKALEQLND
jgi:hypothetical protein